MFINFKNIFYYLSEASCSCIISVEFTDSTWPGLPYESLFPKFTLPSFVWNTVNSNPLFNFQETSPSACFPGEYSVWPFDWLNNWGLLSTVRLFSSWAIGSFNSFIYPFLSIIHNTYLESPVSISFNSVKKTSILASWLIP